MEHVIATPSSTFFHLGSLEARAARQKERCATDESTPATTVTLSDKAPEEARRPSLYSEKWSSDEVSEAHIEGCHMTASHFEASQVGALHFEEEIGHVEIREGAQTVAIPVDACAFQWEEPVCSTAEFAFACATLLLIGMTNFFGYSFVLNAGGAIKDFVYPEAAGLENRLFAFLVSADFIFTAILSVLGALNKKLIFVGIAIMGLSTLGMLICVLVVPGLAGAALVQFFAFAIGAGSSVSCNASLCLANELHNPTYPGVVSTGGGAAGISSFILWIVFSEAVFGHSPSGIKKSLTVILTLGAIGPIFISLMLYVFLRRSWVQQYLRMPKKLPIEGEELESSSPKAVKSELTRLPAGAKRVPDVQTASDLRRSPEAPRTESRFSHVHRKVTRRIRENVIDAVRVLKACYPAALGVFTVLFLCYGVVPVVGPLHWLGLSALQRDVIIGMFQMGDVLGRYTPVLFSSMRPSMGIVFKLILVLLCFDAIVIVTAHYPSIPVITHFAFGFVLILCLAIIMGFTSSLSVIKAPSYLPLHDPLGRSKASSMAILGLLAGASIGQWVSNLLIM